MGKPSSANSIKDQNTNKKEINDDKQDVIGAAVIGASGLVFLLAAQRGLNFILNQLLIRAVNPAVFGLASIQLELLLQTALFISREGFRLCLSRVHFSRSNANSLPTDKFKWFVNISWLTVPLGILLSLVLTFLFSAEISQSNEEYRLACYLFCLASVIETISEPFYIIAQSFLLTKIRVYAEGGALFARSLFTYALLVYFKMGAISFGAAQVIYAVTYGLSYLGYFNYLIAHDSKFPIRSIKSLLPSFENVTVKELLVNPQTKLAWALTLQSVFKHFLTHGDKIVLSYASSYYNQGVYALAQNYGSLAARLIFQPLEESGRLTFGRLGVNLFDENINEGQGASKGAKAQAENTESYLTIFRLYSLLQRLVTVIGLVFAVFGFNYTSVLLRALPGKQWSEHSDSSQVLSWYCVYVLFLAINGISEALVYAITRKDQVYKLSVFSGCSFVVFAAACYPLMNQYGTSGLVMANCLSMLCRIMFSFSFINSMFKVADSAPSQGKRNSFSLIYTSMPKGPIWCLSIVSFVVTYNSNRRMLLHGNSLQSTLEHLALGIMMGTIFLISIYTYETDLLKGLQELWVKRKKD